MFFINNGNPYFDFVFYVNKLTTFFLDNILRGRQRREIWLQFNSTLN